ETNKEGLTELFQQGLDAGNSAIAQGKSPTEVTQAIFKSMASQEGAEAYLGGLFGSMGAAGIGRVANRLRTSPSRSKATLAVDNLSRIESELQNPDLSPSA